MPEEAQPRKSIRVASVIASLTSGGIGPVCRYAAEGMAKLKNWEVTLVSLHDPPTESVDQDTGLRIVCLGLVSNCARRFHEWLVANPQDILITSDVSRIESGFPSIPTGIRHIIQIHDSGRRYRAVAVRNAPWIDGVTCVGKHIEAPLRRNLDRVAFHGLLRTVHNGANFPSTITRLPHNGPLRLLFMGRVEALKGVFDCVPLLQRLKQQGVPVTLNIVGGDNAILHRQLKRKGLDSLVTWSGRVPHERCYAMAAQSDIFLMASRKEPFGMVTIEAMSMGCVPIAYNVPSGSTEIIEHGTSGLLVPLGDIHAWAEEIRALHYNRKRLSGMSAAAMARARTMFHARVMAGRMTMFLEDVLLHAKNNAARREGGIPPETPDRHGQGKRGYQLLPEGLRVWIRNRVCANPRVSYWLLNR
jgi:glycosyltransferase involved in cell wall biosynthesis